MFLRKAYIHLFTHHLLMDKIVGHAGISNFDSATIQEEYYKLRKLEYVEHWCSILLLAHPENIVGSTLKTRPCSSFVKFQLSSWSSSILMDEHFIFIIAIIISVYHWSERPGFNPRLSHTKDSKNGT